MSDSLESQYASNIVIRNTFGNLHTRGRENDIGSKKTPIERIFRSVVKREMTPNEFRLLLAKSKKTRK